MLCSRNRARLRLHSMNFYFASDGASRASSRQSAAAWVVWGVQPGEASQIVAARALLDEHVHSMDAELKALELAVSAFMEIRSGSFAVAHDTDIMLKDWSCLG
eukprot:475388-Karenia_brevis.AAC.1